MLNNFCSDKYQLRPLLRNTYNIVLNIIKRLMLLQKIVYKAAEKAFHLFFRLAYVGRVIADRVF